MSRLQQLAARRAVLIERAARQRAELGECLHRLERPAGIFDKGYALARAVRSHPAIALSTAMAAIFLLRKHLAVGRFAGAALSAAKMGMSLAKWLPSRKPER
ncbi:MAG TPA: YqjK family protein [Novimethylophilus sp.]|jgi:hypothetical protein|uniref:YqjK family protein n=1 Tax=Novimethylophilus sp. TaxID=2137426 RepID=UPI002F3F55E3